MKQNIITNHEESPMNMIVRVCALVIAGIMLGSSLHAMEATLESLRDDIQKLEAAIKVEENSESKSALEQRLALVRQEAYRLEMAELKQALEESQRVAQEAQARLKQIEAAEKNSEDASFTLRVENEDTQPLYVALVERYAPEGWGGYISWATSRGYTDKFIVPSQEIQGSQTIELRLPKKCGAYQRWLCWDVKPITDTNYSQTIPLENLIEEEKLIPLITENGIQKREAQAKEAALKAAETFDLRLTNKNLEPVFVALVGREAPSGYVATPLSYLTRAVYTDSFLTEPCEIKPQETVTFKVPKRSLVYQRWICWDNKPLTNPSAGVTSMLEQEIIEHEKSLDIVSAERSEQLEEAKLQAKLAQIKDHIQVVPQKSMAVDGTYLLKLKNLDTKALHVALIAGVAPTKGLGWAGSYVSSRAHACKKLTESLEIPQGKSLILQIPKNIDCDSLWIYWDIRPLVCENNTCTGSYIQQSTTVAQEAQTVRLMTTERKHYLEKGGERLILKRNQEPAAQNESVVTSNPDQLTIDEIDACEARDSTVTPALRTIVQGQPQKLPRIGMCLSGGGLRAMFSSLGLSQGLRDTGLLNTLTFTAGLSGSTWFLMKWLEQGGSPEKLDEIAHTLRDSMAKGLIPKQLLDPVTKELSKWAAFTELAYGGSLDHDPEFQAQFRASLICPEGNPSKRTPSLIDLWGYFLARRLFKGHDDAYQFTLSSLKETAGKGSMPLPIFTAIDSRGTQGYIESMTKWAWSNREQEPPKIYKWLEVTPFAASLRNGSSLCEIPTWGLGRRYKQQGFLNRTTKSVCEPSYFFEPFLKTKPQEGEPRKEVVEYMRIEPSACQLLGAFGSAFTVSLGEAAKLFEETAGDYATQLEWAALGAQVLGTVLPAAQPLTHVAQLAGVMRHVTKDFVKSDKDVQFFAGLGLYDFASGNDEQLELRDAGVFYNLPLPALFDSRRDCDIVLIHDTSGDLHEMQDGTPMIGSELAKFVRYPQFAGKKLPHDLRSEATFKTKMDEIYTNKRLIAVFNDPRSKDYCADEITVIYLPTVIHHGIEGLEFSPTERFGTFKLQYNTDESEALMGYSRALARHAAQEIREIIREKTRKMNE